MDVLGKYTGEEILTQPAAWSAALDVLEARRRDLASLGRGGYAQVLFTGCGSTYYAALAAAALLQELSGIAARGLPASELWLYPRSSFCPGKTLLIALSRSGETTETLQACAAFAAAGRGDLLTLSCYADRPLAGMGKWNVVLPSGQERSIAQTRAFTTLYLATVWLAALWAGKDELAGMRRLEDRGRRLLARCAALASDLGRDESLDRFYWLGSGPRYGLACEVSLKMKEMSLSHSEPFHFMEFRHGPKSMLTPSALVVGLRSSLQAEREAAVLKDAAALGARVLTIAEDPQADVALECGLDEAIRNVLYLPVGQLIAFERSVARGLNPDLPHHLDAVVRLT